METSKPLRSRKPKLAKYRPQLTKPEIDLIISCLTAALVSGYNNPGLPGVIKKFKILAHKIDLDAIGAGYTVAKPAQAAPAKQQSYLSSDKDNTDKDNKDNTNKEETEGKETSEESNEADAMGYEELVTLSQNSQDTLASGDLPQEPNELEPVLTEEYVWEKYQALGGSPEAMEVLSSTEQALVSMYKANERMELTEEDNERISAYMLEQLS